MLTPILTGRDHFAITPSDSVALTKPCHAIYVGGTGAVKFVSAVGNTETWSACPVGLIIPVAATQVLATGTTATLLIGITI